MKSKVLTMAVLVAAAGAFSADKAAAQEMASVTGEVIDITCYIAGGMKGEDHRMCAQVCADVGLPLGILSTDGHVYMTAGKGMPAPPATDMLKGHAAHQVTVEGAVTERDGARLIVVDKVSM